MAESLTRVQRGFEIALAMLGTPATAPLCRERSPRRTVGVSLGWRSDRPLTETGPGVDGFRRLR